MLRYAERVRRDPSTSLVYDMKEANEEHFSAGADTDAGDIVLTGTHKVVLVLFALAFGVMVYGVIPWEDLEHRPPHAVVVVPGDDRLVPALRDRHRHRRAR